ncbi:MAG: glycosyltransferase [Chloroflexi bacterium]|nr:glycosyltransferase [Chloroflexota bacterium]
MRILLVAHGFPPVQFGGTEMYTYSLGKELSRRGVDVHVVFTRYEGLGQRPEESQAEGSAPQNNWVRPDGLAPIRFVTKMYHYDGITCWQIPIKEHYLTSLENTYRDPFIDQQFHVVLEQVRPDIVHFLYMLGGLSASMVPLSKSLGVPALATLTDFSLMCPFGQLLKPDGQQCAGPGDSRGCAACTGEMSGYFEYLAWLKEISSPRPAESRPDFLLAGLARHVATLAPISSADSDRLVAVLSNTQAKYNALRRKISPGATGHRRSRSQEPPQKASGRERDTTLVSKFPRTERAYMERARYLKWALTQLDAVVAPTRYLMDRFVEWGVDRSKVLFSEYGVDDSLFRSFLKVPSDHLRFGYIGQIQPHKGVGTLLEAFSQLDSPTATLTVYGDTNSLAAKEYLGKIGHLTKAPRVTMAGTFPPDRIAAVMSRMDVLVVPSIWAENSPLVVRNALLAHLPVVASNVEGLTIYVRNGQNGLTFEPGDARGLLACLARFVTEPGLVEQMSKATPPTKIISEDAKQLMDVYRQLAGKRSRTGDDIGTADESS